MTASSQLIAHADLGEFFRGEVSEARAQLGLELPDMAEFYVVNLLCEFGRRG